MVVFKDKFPLEVEFEINRELLVRYYRFQSLIVCVGLVVPFSLLFAFGFLKSFLVMHADFTFAQKVISTACFGVGGVAVGLLVAMIFYFPYFHKSSELAAQNLRLRVEGPYLRLISGGHFVTDRRYHFKDLHTYTIYEGPLLKRFGMKSLRFHVSIRQMPPVQIDGIIDIESVRDKLCEIDASREDACLLPQRR